MSIFSRIFGPRNAVTGADSSQITRGSALWTAFTGNTSIFSNVDALNEGTAYTVPAVSACVQIIAGSVASLPAHVYLRGKDGDLTRQYEHPLWWVLNEEFSPRWTAAAGWWFLVASKLLHGDAFAEIKRDKAGRVNGLLPVHPSRVRVMTDPDGQRLLYVVQPDGTIDNPSEASKRQRVINGDDMLHVPGFGFNGVRGLSMLQYSLRTSGNLAVNAQTFSAQFFKNSAKPQFYVQTDGVLTDAQFKRMQDMIDGIRGPDNAGREMLLEGGAKLVPLTMPMEDIQLLETRKFGVEEIARAFMVPPFMIGHTEKTSSWGSGVAEMGSGFVRYTLRDHLTAFHNEMNRKLFPRSSFCIEFDTMELERGDTKTMVEAVRTAIGRAGEQQIMSVEEGRQFLRLPRKIAGDVQQDQPQEQPPATP